MRRRRRRGQPEVFEALIGIIILGLVGIALRLAGALMSAIPRWLDQYADLLAIVLVAGIIGAVVTTRILAGRGRSSTPPERPIASSREPIPAGLRFAVLRRDGFRCAYCGRGESDGAKLHIDHLIPVARGGPTELDNLVTACADCNLGKSATDLVG